VNDDLIEKLRSLDGRNSSSTLRNLMPVIDPQIKRGVSHEAVIATLAEAGMKVNIYTFRSALYAYRKKQRQLGGKIEASDQPVQAQSAQISQTADPQAVLEQALDPNGRESLGDHYLTRRPPIIRS